MTEEHRTRRDTRRTVLKAAGTAGALGMTGLAGCAGGGGGGDDVSDLTVGYASSLSGPFASFGQAGLDGARLAVEDLEEELGVSIDVVTGDTQTNANTAFERIQRLVTEDDVDFVMGGVSSSAALRMGTWASDNDVVYFSTGAHSDAITGGNCAPNVFRPTCSNSMLANAVGQRMVDAADEWFVIYSDYTWGQTAQSAVKRVLEANGKTVTGTAAAPFPNDDYSQYLNEAASSDSAGIALLVAGLDLRKAVNGLVNKGMQDDHAFAIHQLEDSVLWGLDKQSAAVMDTGAQVWGPAAPGGDEFKRRVADEAELDPYVRHFLGYVSMDQAVRAADRAGSTAAEDMRAELEGHEVSSPIKEMKGGGEMYWRECDHQLVQPTFGVRGRDPDEMSDSPYKTWFEVDTEYAGGDVVRPCEDTGCSF